MESLEQQTSQSNQENEMNTASTSSTKKEFAVIAAYDHAGYKAGQIISTHKSYELARKAAKRSGYDTFRAVNFASDL